MMNNKEILKQAIALKPDDRFMIVEGILKSLDEPDKKIDDIWAQEAEKRLKAYRKGELKGIPMEDIPGLYAYPAVPKEAPFVISHIQTFK